MKKIVSLLLIMILTVGNVIATSALAPPNYPDVTANTVEEMVSWIATENADTFQEGKYKEFLTDYREKGEMLVGYYLKEDGTSSISSVEATIPGITFYNLEFSATVQTRLIEPEYESLLEKSLNDYLNAVYSIHKWDFSKLPVQKATLTNGETIDFVVIEHESGAINAHFIWEGHEVRIHQYKKYDVKNIEQIQFMKLPIKKASELKGYGDVLISRNYLEGGFWSEDELSQNGRNTEKELQEYVEKYIDRNRGSSFGVDWKIINAEFVPAVAGTREEPKGKDGYYTFQISLSKEKAQNIVTKPLTVTIKARELRNITGFQTEEQQVTANVVQAEDSVNQLMIVAYKDNMMLEAKTVDAVGTDEITAQIPKDANRVKAFLWEKPEQPEAQTYKLRSITPTYELSLNPQCPAWELTKNEQGEWE